MFLFLLDSLVDSLETHLRGAQLKEKQFQSKTMFAGASSCTWIAIPESRRRRATSFRRRLLRPPELWGCSQDLGLSERIAEKWLRFFCSKPTAMCRWKEETACSSLPFEPKIFTENLPRTVSAYSSVPTHRISRALGKLHSKQTSAASDSTVIQLPLNLKAFVKNEAQSGPCGRPSRRQ